MASTPDLQAIASAYGGVVRGDQALIPSPGHSTRDRGTSVKLDPSAPGGCLVHSFNGGDALAIKEELRDRGFIRENGPRTDAGGWRRTGTYTFRDEAGEPLYRTHRLEHPRKPKRYEVERADGVGGWISKIGDSRRVLYRLPELMAADPAEPIYFVEGERKADKLAEWGLMATAIAFGANSWRREYATALAGRTIVILPDHDKPGYKFAAIVKADIEACGGTAHVLQLPDLPAKGDIIDWRGSAEELRSLTDALLARGPENAVENVQVSISATPFAWTNPATIPLRPWVYGRWLLRNTITAVVAPGGVGKSALMASTVLALATGRELLGKTVWEGPRRVWYWNLEDDSEELSRQIHAAAIRHGVSPADCGDRLFVDSGLDGTTLCIADESRDGFRILQPVIDALVAELRKRKIDVLIIDPFVSSHAVSENDNGAIDAVAKMWGRVAKQANCSIVLVHHTRKLAGQKVTAEMSRGAVALISAARTALVLNRMDSDEAARFGIESDKDQRQHFNVQDDKHNRAPPEAAEWYRIEGVDLGNGDEDHSGDNIGVVVPWSPPDPFDGLSVRHLFEVQQRLREGEWADNVQARDWAGIAVAEVIGADLENKSDKARVKSLIRSWKETGALKVEHRDTSKGRSKPFLIVGKAIDASDLPTLKSGVGKAGEVG